MPGLFKTLMENYPNFNQIINNKDIFNYIMINEILYCITDMITHVHYTMYLLIYCCLVCMFSLSRSRDYDAADK